MSSFVMLVSPPEFQAERSRLFHHAVRTFRDAKDRFVADFEKGFLVQALRRNGGNITKAAEEVGMYRQNFQQKMRELGISADETEK